MKKLNECLTHFDGVKVWIADLEMKRKELVKAEGDQFHEQIITLKRCLSILRGYQKLLEEKKTEIKENIEDYKKQLGEISDA